MSVREAAFWRTSGDSPEGTPLCKRSSGRTAASFWGGEIGPPFIGGMPNTGRKLFFRSRKGYLRLYARKAQAKENTAFSYLGVRQNSYSMHISTRLEFELDQEGDAVGLLLFQNQKNHLKMEVIKTEEKFVFRVTQVVQGQEEILAENRYRRKSWKYI